MESKSGFKENILYILLIISTLSLLMCFSKPGTTYFEIQKKDVYEINADLLHQIKEVKEQNQLLQLQVDALGDLIKMKKVGDADLKMSLTERALEMKQQKEQKEKRLKQLQKEQE